MKLFVALLVVFGLAAVLPRPFSLQEDLHDFIELLPLDEIQNIVINYVVHDAEVNHMFAYLQSNEFKDFILGLEGIPEYKEYLKYVQTHGIDVYDYLEKLHDLLGIPPFVPLAQTAINGTGLRGMVDEIEALLPLEEIKTLYYQKLESSAEFRNVIDLMRSEDFVKIVDQVNANPEFQKIVAEAKSHGLDIELINSLLEKIFGWNHAGKFTGYGLKEDFGDFIALLPIEKIKAITNDYLANDAEVKRAVAFAQSEVYKKMVLDIESIKEHQDCMNYLQNHGIGAYEALKKLHEIIGLPPYIPSENYQTARRRTGIRGLFHDIDVELPLAKIKILYNEKLETSVEFYNLIQVLESDEFKRLTGQFYANLRYQEIITNSKEQGFDVALIEHLIFKMFGWAIGM